ncbi:MAG: hypothetical protein QGG40_21260, partial [Myxococcota bacterium]|nr:hypothetical protein [Myxococcota bacterium]
FLAYLGLTSIRAQEQAVMADVQSPAQAVAQVYWRETDRFFGRLENEVLKRLRAGESPLDGLKSLHPMLQAAARLDGEGNLVGPFLDEEGDGRQVLEYLFDPAITRARELEQEEPETAGAGYGERADTWTDRALRGRALLDMARMLSASGQGELAEQAWRRVEEQFGPVRDPWGFRLGDLARLHLGRLELQEDRSAPLRELVDDLLVARWTVGEGGEAAVARQAVSLLDAVADRDWLAGTRSRIAERSQQLYWTSALLPEIQPIVAASQRQGVASGQFHWTLGARALWATTWWNGEQYAFGLDLGTVVSELKDRARSSVGFEEPITAYLIGPSEAMEQDALATRNLAPWLTGWNFVVVPRDPTGLERKANRQRWLRLMVVLFAVTMISLGGVVSFRLVRTELGLARMKSDFAAGVSHELRS